MAEVLSDAVEFPNFSCALMAPFRNDPQGAWSRSIAVFPGSGESYPLAPGATSVVATDAIDHRAISPDLPDLSRANFEFLGDADVDNPGVPNMVFQGVAPYDGGHGISGIHSVVSAVWVLGSKINVPQLTLAPVPPNAKEYLRVPTSAILDSFVSRNLGQLDPSLGLTPCPELINREIDRKEGFFLQDDPNAFSRSASKKSLMTLASGRIVLWNTRSSALDYRTTSRTPGSVQ
jgi:hypothetical protein